MRYPIGSLLVLLTLCAVPPAFAAHDQAIDQAVQFLVTQQNADGSWGAGEAEKPIHTMAAVHALRAAGNRNGAYYRGVTWLENHAAPNADYAARRAGILHAHGDDVAAVVAALENAQNAAFAGRAGWGVSAHYLQAPLDTALVLAAFNQTGSGADIQAAIDYLKGAQSGDGGWASSLESASDPFSTAQVVKALVPLQGQDSALATSIANALTHLSTAVTTAAPSYLQALAAHAAILANDPSAAQPWLNYLAGTQAGDGSWGGGQVYDTALALRALAAADSLDTAANQSAVLVPDPRLRAAINAALGRPAMSSLDRSELLRLIELLAAERDIADLTGLEWALNLQSADLRNNNITSTAPIDGLTQLTSLQLDGNPVADAGGNDEDIPTLPEWGMILLAVLLLWTAWRHQGAEPTRASEV